MPTPPPQQAHVAFTLPVTTTERLSLSVALSEQLVPSSTVPESSVTTTESMAATSTGLEAQVETQTAPEHIEPT
jgi:hypothetical protein